MKLKFVFDPSSPRNKVFGTKISIFSDLFANKATGFTSWVPPICLCLWDLITRPIESYLRMVELPVLGVSNYLKIFYSIISFNPIYVMDMLTLLKTPTKMLLHEISMVVDSLTTYITKTISMTINPKFLFGSYSFVSSIISHPKIMHLTYNLWILVVRFFITIFDAAFGHNNYYQAYL